MASSIERPILGENALSPLNTVLDNFTNKYGMRALADDSSKAKSSREAAMLFMQAEGFADEGDTSACLAAASKALSLFREAGDKKSANDALAIIVRAHFLKAESTGERAEEAVKVATEELAKFAKAKDTMGEACMQLALAEVYAGMIRGGKNLRKAEDCARDAMGVFNKLNNKSMVAKAHIVLANIYYQSSKATDCADNAYAAMEIFKDKEDKMGMAKALHGIALSYAITEEYEEAVNSAQEALSIYRELGHKYSEAFELQVLAKWHIAQKKPWKAVVAAKEAYAIHCGMEKSIQGEAVALLLTCTAMIANSRERQAAKLAKKGLERFQATGDKAGVAAGFEVLLHIYMAMGNVKEAFNSAQEALSIAKGLEDKRLELNLLHATCKVRLAAGMWEDALNSMRDAIELAQEVDDLEEEAMALRMMCFINITSGAVRLDKDIMYDVQQCTADAQLLFQNAEYASGEASMYLISATLKDSNADVLSGAKEAHALYKETGDLEGESAALKLIIDACLVDKNYAEAMKYADARVQLWKLAGKKSMQAEALHKVASIHLQQSEWEEAEDTILTGQQLAQDVGEKGLESALLLLMVQVNINKMSKEEIPKDVTQPMPASFLDLRKATHEAATDAMKLASTEDDRDLHAAVQFWRSEMLIWNFQPHEALNSAEKAASIFADIGNSRGQVHSQVLTADLWDMVGEKPTALKIAEKALAVANAMPDAPEEQSVAQAMVTKLSAKPKGKEPKGGGKKGKKGKKSKKAKKPKGGGSGKTKIVKKLVSKGGGKKSGGLEIVPTQSKIMDLVKEVAASDEETDNDTPFMEAGIDSLGSVQLVTDIGKAFSMSMAPSAIFDFPNVRSLAEHLVEESGGGGGGDEPAEDQWIEVEVPDDEDGDGDDDDSSDEESSDDDDDDDDAGPAGGEIVEATSLVIEKKAKVAEPKGLDPIVTQKKVTDLVKNVVASGDDEDFDLDNPLMEAGVDSLGSVQLVTDLSKEFSMPLSPSAIFDFPTVRSLADHLVEESQG